MNRYYDFIVIGIYVYFTLIWCTFSVCSMIINKKGKEVGIDSRYRLSGFIKNLSTTISAILLLIMGFAIHDKKSMAIYLMYIIVMLILLVIMILPLIYTFALVYVILSKVISYKSEKYKVLCNTLVTTPIALILWGTLTGWIGLYSVESLITYMINTY